MSCTNDVIIILIFTARLGETQRSTVVALSVLSYVTEAALGHSGLLTTRTKGEESRECFKGGMVAYFG